MESHTAIESRTSVSVFSVSVLFTPVFQISLFLCSKENSFLTQQMQEAPHRRTSNVFGASPRIVGIPESTSDQASRAYRSGPIGRKASGIEISRETEPEE